MHLLNDLAKPPLKLDNGRVITPPSYYEWSNLSLIQMWFHFALIQVLMDWSLQKCVHDTTAVLSWHVQNFVVVWSTAIEKQLIKISIEFELW